MENKLEILKGIVWAIFALITLAAAIESIVYEAYCISAVFAIFTVILGAGSLTYFNKNKPE